MAYTFFNAKSKIEGDKISLTRFWGPASLGGSRHCLQISTTRFKESNDCPKSERESQFLPGWSYVCLTRDEVIALRDNLNRFIEGVSDGSSVGTFDNPMTTKERADLNKGGSV